MLRQMGVFVETEGERQTAKRQTSDLLALRPGDPNTRTLHFVRVPADSSLPLEDMDATMYVAVSHIPSDLHVHARSDAPVLPASDICGGVRNCNVLVLHVCQHIPCQSALPKPPYSVQICALHGCLWHSALRSLGP